VQLYDTFLLALKNIANSKMRTFLTMLGIIIGVCAVIVIVGLGNGMAKYMESIFSDMGTNTIGVNVYGRGTSRSATEEDIYAIVDANPQLFRGASPEISMGGGVRIGTKTYLTTQVTGINESYLGMKGYKIKQGRDICYVDILERKDVCVVGSYVSQSCFAGSAVGQTLKKNGVTFTVVGVLEQQVDDMTEGGPDDRVYIPSSTAARMSYMGTINSYVFTLRDVNDAVAGREAIQSALFDIYGSDDAYYVMSMAEMLESMTSAIGVVIMILTIIAGISLVVGGIGIMNIMLVSVTERTREIGIRKALGAREGVILRQFVIEAASTSALGGFCGIILGYMLSAVATRLTPMFMETAITVSPSVNAVLIAFGVSVGIGILFGYLPARKAARLNPIEALRYE